MKKETESLWAGEKYTIMAKSYAFYKDIQGKMRDAESDEDYHVIQQLISTYKKEPYDVKAVVNTLEHVWGYFKKSANEEDKQQFFSLMNDFRNTEEQKIDEIPDEIIENLHHLLEKYPSDYLLSSTFIKK